MFSFFGHDVEAHTNQVRNTTTMLHAADCCCEIHSKNRLAQRQEQSCKSVEGREREYTHEIMSNKHGKMLDQRMVCAEDAAVTGGVGRYRLATSQRSV